MVSFSSLEFLFRFLPVFLGIYFAVPAKYRESALLFGSIIFYAAGEPVFILALILCTLVNYYFGMEIWKLGIGFEMHGWQKKKRKSLVKQAVALDCCV